MKKNKLTKEQKMLEKIKKIYEKYPEPIREINDWNKGGFITEEKYKQPIKHKIYR
jgi:hypothetical protein